jgi:acid phosphatase family membrane protein YuiD
LLFAYDAMNLRFQTGQHAHFINKLRFELQWIFLKEQVEKLRERLWHTPLEVLWGFVIWSSLTYVLYYLFFL